MKKNNPKIIAKLTEKATKEFVKAIQKDGMYLSEKVVLLFLGTPNCHSFKGLLTHAYALAATWGALLARAKQAEYDVEQLKELFSIVRDKNYYAFEQIAKEEAEKEEHEQE